jgi:2-polyprenyl-3-methyl-5-hydroxy-6-metoxy-1,4-benzoquinol methylase
MVVRSVSRLATAGADMVTLDSIAWGKTRVLHADLELLAEHTGTSQAECIERLRDYDPAEMAQEWHAREAGTLDFYARTGLYLWELISWHGSEAYVPYLRRLENLMARFPPAGHPQALDYGSGVGTTALRLAEQGYRVTLADVPGKTLEFACARLRRAGLDFDVLEIREDVPQLGRNIWDLVVSFDVLEHVVDPAAAARRLVGALRVGGGAAITVTFADEGKHPHHLAPGIERFHGHRWNLWVQSLGMRYLGDDLYRKTGKAEHALLGARYVLWQLSGFYVSRPAR